MRISECNGWRIKQRKAGRATIAGCHFHLSRACLVLLGALWLSPAFAQLVVTRSPGGVLIQKPASSYSGTPANIQDGNTNSAWVSNFSFTNVFQFAFDLNNDGSYTSADSFRLDQLKMVVPNGSSWAVKTFKVETQAYGSSLWLPLYSGTSTYPTYNFAATPYGGSLTSAPTSSYSGAPTNIVDGTVNTAWVSNFSMNNILEFAFDPNLNGTTALAGDTADRFTLDTIALSNGNSSWSVKDFTLDVKRNGSATWQQLYSVNGSDPAYNFAATAKGGKLVASPSSSYSGTPANVIDSTTNTAWVSNFSMKNVLQFAFDPNLNGTTGLAGDALDRFTLDSVTVNNGNSSWSLKDFLLDVKRNGSSTWEHLLSAQATFPAYNFADSARGGAIVTAPATAYSGTPANIIDNTINTAWVSNFSMKNVIELAFDPTLNGMTGLAGDAADRFSLDSVALNNGNSSWSVKDFQLDVKRNGTGVWEALYASTSIDPAYNFATTAHGGVLTSSPSSSYSGTPANIIDDTTNTAWVSNFSMNNVLELAFDPNLNGTTAAVGDTSDRFTLDAVTINNGNSSWSLKDFRLDVKRNGGSTWQALYSANTTYPAYNFAANAQGGKLVSAPATAYSGTAANIIDSSVNTAWVSNFSMSNVFELAFDPNMNGTTAAAGDTSDRFSLDTLNINNGNSSWSMQDFLVDIKRNGSATWQPLYAANTTYPAYNFAATARGGKLVSAPGSSYSGTPANVIDGTTNTAWVSNYSQVNTLEFSFDPILSGSGGYAIGAVNEVTINNGGSGWGLKDFEIWVNAGGSWSKAGSFTAAQTAATQTFTLTPIANVIGIRLKTLNSYSGSVLQINEFEVHGSYTGLNPVFTAAQSAATQTFDFRAINSGNLDNVESVRLTTVNNFGGSVLQINEIELLGSYSGANPVFTAPQSASTTVFSLAAANAGNLGGIDALRLTTLNNYGGSVVQINEMEALGSWNGKNPVFTAAQSSATQSFDLTTINAGKLSGVDSVRLTTLNNYGGSVVQINEFEVHGSFTGKDPVFTAPQSSATSTFTLGTLNSSTLSGIDSLRLTTLNNYGGSVVQINEIEAHGNFVGKNPVFTAAQTAAMQTFDLTTANSGNLSGIDALRMTTLNNFGGSVVQINEVEARGAYTGNNPVFTASNSPGTNTYDLTLLAANNDRRNSLSGLRLTTLDNYGGSVVQINEFEGIGLLTGANVPSSFNCIETGLGYVANATPPATRNPLYTKLAGSAFSFDVVALKADGTIETGYASGQDKNVTVELVDGSGATACASRVAVSPAVVQTLTFKATDAGRKTAASMNVANAYPDLRCRVTDANQSPSVVSCSGDDFSIRPSAITLLTTANAVPPSATATPALKTGSNFTLQASTNGNYAGNLSLDTSKLTAQISSDETSITNGGIVGSFLPVSLTGNIATNASYSEVGYLYLAPGAFRDETFTAVDSLNGDCITDTTGNSNLADTLSGNKYGCSIGNKSSVSLGRFVPDHFDITVNSNGQLASTCSSGAFSYTGQAISYAAAALPMLTIKPMNAATGGSVTQNYQNKFQRLTGAGISLASPTADASQLGLDGASKTALTAVLNAGSLSNVGGTMTYTLSSADKFTYTRNGNALIGPYISDIPLVVSAVSDSETAAAGTLPTLKPAGVSLRFGRLRLSNKYGSEKSPLQVPVQAQYWSAAGDWQKNTADSCTTVPASAIGLRNPVDNKGAAISVFTNATGSVSITAGQGTANLAASAPITGSIDVCLDLGNDPVGGVVCSATSANLPYLQGKWYPGTAFDNDPLAKATFGVYAPETRKAVHVREIY